MGIGLVLVTFVVAGSACASFTAVVLGSATAFTLPTVPGRRRAIIAVCAFPFACFLWSLGIFLLQAYVNEMILYRDPGVGDSWQTPLPNGYALLMIDEKRDGMVFNPKTRFIGDGDVAIGPHDEDALGRIAVLQVSGPYILGRTRPDMHARPPSRSPQGEAENYFLLDTTTRRRSDFPTYTALCAAVTPLGIQPKLEPIATIYRRYRFTWFDALALALLALPPLSSAIVLYRWILRLRNPRVHLVARPTRKACEERLNSQAATTALRSAR
jgi:hypothetical protein